MHADFAIDAETQSASIMNPRSFLAQDAQMSLSGTMPAAIDWYLVPGDWYLRAATAYNCAMRHVLLLMVGLVACASVRAQSPTPPALHAQSPTPPADAQRWVETTFKSLTLDQMVGQVLMPRFASLYTSTDSDAYDQLASLVHNAHVGGVIGFGGEELVPPVLLNSTYGSIILGQPFALASMLNRLQAIAPIPLLTAADFEWGVGMRIAGATKFPRAMAFGAAGDESLATEAGRVTAVEGRALGVHIDLAPVVDVNNNPRNPVINIRSFGEDPARAGALATAFARGLQSGGMLATLKHFPGHGDTAVDSHLGLPVVGYERARLDAVELVPFRMGIAAGADAVMVAHVEMPALDKTPGPATFSQAVVTGLLREQLGFDGLILSDAMNMDAVTALGTAGDNAVKAFNAGIDVILDSRDTMGAFRGLKAAVESGTISRARLEASVRRVLTAKARLGLHRSRLVSFDALPTVVGTRKHTALAQQISDRAVTLIKDERGNVPLKLAADRSVLYLSVLDYPAQWRTAAPSRTVIPQLRARWRDTDTVEVSDVTTPDELALIRTMANRYDAIIAGVYVRASSGSGRIDLAPPVVRLLQDLARASAKRNQPMLTVFFGNPYVPLTLPELPAMLETYDFTDYAELSAVRAIAGEIPITGKLPIALPGMFPVGHGLTRPAGGTKN
jgi:beta-N-acetylhexosaminidase